MKKHSQLLLSPEWLNRKICVTCREERPLSEYHRNPNTSDGYYSSCRGCCSKYQKKYRARNRDKLRQSKKEYRERNREKVLARKRKYATEHRKQESARAIQWQKDNPKRVRMRSKLRQFRKRTNGGEVTKEQWLSLCKLFGYKCASCREKKKLEMDHIVPVAMGGLGDIMNLQPLCRSCNASKGTSTVDYRPVEIITWAEKEMT